MEFIIAHQDPPRLLDKYTLIFVMVGSTKRKALEPSDESYLNIEVPSLEDRDDVSSPAKIRRQIRSFLESGEMTVTHFLEVCGNVNSNSYRRFMALKGDSGVDNNTYHGALYFFEKRKMAGLPVVPSKKKAKASNTDAGDDDDTGSGDVDISGVHLPREETGETPIFDTCDEVRRKINAFLRKDGSPSRAAFMRQLCTLSHEPNCQMQSKQINDFLNKKGPLAGAESKVYLLAYLFFEKRRIAEDKPVSKMRQETQKRWPQGISRYDIDRRGVRAHSSEIVSVDKYGQLEITSMGGSTRRPRYR